VGATWIRKPGRLLSTSPGFRKATRLVVRSPRWKSTGGELWAGASSERPVTILGYLPPPLRSSSFAALPLLSASSNPAPLSRKEDTQRPSRRISEHLGLPLALLLSSPRPLLSPVLPSPRGSQPWRWLRSLPATRHRARTGSRATTGSSEFDLCQRNAFLKQQGAQMPGFKKTGTTISGAIFKVGCSHANNLPWRLFQKWHAHKPTTISGETSKVGCSEACSHPTVMPNPKGLLSADVVVVGCLDSRLCAVGWHGASVDSTNCTLFLLSSLPSTLTPITFTPCVLCRTEWSWEPILGPPWAQLFPPRTARRLPSSHPTSTAAEQGQPQGHVRCHK